MVFVVGVGVFAYDCEMNTLLHICDEKKMIKRIIPFNACPLRFTVLKFTICSDSSIDSTSHRLEALSVVNTKQLLVPLKEHAINSRITST